MSTKQDSLIKNRLPCFYALKVCAFWDSIFKKSIFVYKKYFFIMMLTQQNCDTIKLYVNKICLYDIKRYLVGRL